MSFWCNFIFRPKNPRKTAVNAMKWRTNEMLKSEYFAKVTSSVSVRVGYIRYQQVAHPWQSHGVDYTALIMQ